RWGSEKGSIAKFDIGARTVRMAAFSPDSKWLALGLKDNTVLLRQLYDGTAREIKLPTDHFPRGLAFDPDGQRLAVGVGSSAPGSKFFIEADEPVAIYDIANNPPREEARLKHSGKAEAIAWHGRDRLAVAGGDSH